MDALVYLTREPTRPSGGKASLLLLLHGLGSHEADLMGLAPDIDGRFFVASARGPVTLAPGAYAWFHTEFTPQGPVINPEEAERSRTMLIRFVDDLVEKYDLDPDRVYLMGFSQGAIIGLSVALTAPEALAGVVAMSGRILPQVRAQIAAPDRLAGLPVLVVHGRYDPLLPVDEYGRPARDLLAALPVALTYREYAMAHQVSDESLEDVTRWLTARLDRPRRDDSTGPEGGR
jgi:phospholipase/carboxylesterase